MYSESLNVVRNERGQVLTWFFIIFAIAAQSQLAGAQQGEHPAADWSRVVPVGARVRILDAAGHLIEGDIGARSDSVLWLQAKRKSSAQPIVVSDIRSLEVRALPESRRRMILVSVGVGAVLGALAGAASHGDTGSSPGLGGKPNRFENVSVGALFGAGIGWGLGHFAFARERRQQVRLR